VTSHSSAEDSDPTGDAEHEAEWRQFYLQHAAGLHRYLWNLARDEDAVASAAQDAFLATRRAWAEVRGYGKPKAWLYKVARRCLRHQKPPGYSMMLPRAPLADLPDPASLSDDVVQRQLVQNAIDQLPRRLKEVAVLRYVCGFTIEDTAVILGITAGSVKSYQHTARGRLQELLKN
jgi:RNA polymerase sigma factor (sigma-70 family)